MLFHNGTIDQPGKKMAAALHAKWAAGRQPFESCDVWMLIATIPIVSQWGGIPPNNPAQVLKERLAAGMKLVVIDPRRTDVARAAHIHLQPKRGEDSSILAAMIRIILDERLFDASFVDAEVQGIEDLRRAFDRFTPGFAARRADVPAEQIIAAARMFAAGKRGCVTGGTGINMAPHGSLTEYLVLVLNSICGRWMRAGERYPNPLAYLPAPDPKAQPLPRQKPWGFGAKMRVRELEETVAGVPTAALAEEILMPGAGQIKALLLVAANPVVAWPDQARTMAALRHLELSVTIFNSTGQHLPELRQPHNPALMNQEDAQREGLTTGDLIEIRSEHGAIRGIVQTTLGLRRGVTSMSHGFGDATLDDERVRSVGSPTGRLISTDRHFDPVTGIPRMSAVPVSVRRL